MALLRVDPALAAADDGAGAGRPTISSGAIAGAALPGPRAVSNALLASPPSQELYERRRTLPICPHRPCARRDRARLWAERRVKTIRRGPCGVAYRSSHDLGRGRLGALLYAALDWAVGSLRCRRAPPWRSRARRNPYRYDAGKLYRFRVVKRAHPQTRSRAPHMVPSSATEDFTSGRPFFPLPPRRLLSPTSSAAILRAHPHRGAPASTWAARLADKADLLNNPASRRPQLFSATSSASRARSDIRSALGTTVGA